MKHRNLYAALIALNILVIIYLSFNIPAQHTQLLAMIIDYSVHA